MDKIVIPAIEIPSFRTAIAIKQNTHQNILLSTWGGIGDQICSEPTLRYALSRFKNERLTLCTDNPELFEHLQFAEVISTREGYDRDAEFLRFEMIRPSTSLVWEFMSHMIVNCVDYPSLCAFRSQLPVAERELFISSKKPDAYKMSQFKNNENQYIFVHAGKHWPSKTFPKDWWDSVLCKMISYGLTPVLIGADADDNRGTVDVETRGCLDLRNKLTVMESIWLLQRAQVLITNDSSPLHMAASRDPAHSNTGHCWIGFIASCKHPDFITHWRRGVWNYREENLGLGGMWENISTLPNNKEEITLEFVDETLLRSWLPKPDSVASWAVSKMRKIQ